MVLGSIDSKSRPAAGLSKPQKVAISSELTNRDLCCCTHHLLFPW